MARKINSEEDSRNRTRANGEGNIRQRKDGSWEARYSIGCDNDGKQIRKSVYGKTRGEVSEKLKKILYELSIGTYVEPTKITVKQWCNDWLENYKRHEIKPKTFECYRNIIRLHIEPLIGHVALKELRPEIVQRLYKSVSDKGLSARTVTLTHVTLHAALKQALLNGLIAKNPTEATTRPKKKQHEKEIWSLEEQVIFMNNIEGHEHQLAFMLGLTLGLRIGEICGLEWKNVDLNNKTLQVKRTLQRIQTGIDKKGEKTKLTFVEPKTEKSRRTLPLTDELIQLLKTHRIKQIEHKMKLGNLWQNTDDNKAEIMVLTTPIGNPLDPRQLTESFYKATEAAKLKRTNFHSLRHCFCTRALESGIELKTVSELAGHSTIVLTANTYSHVLHDKKVDAVNKLQTLYREAR